MGRLSPRNHFSCRVHGLVMLLRWGVMTLPPRGSIFLQEALPALPADEGGQMPESAQAFLHSQQTAATVSSEPCADFRLEDVRNTSHRVLVF